MADNGNPPIEFKADHTAVVCVLQPSSAPENEQANEQVNTGLTELQAALHKEVGRNPGIAYEELVPIVKRSRATIVRNFSKLKQAGILTRIGSDKTGKWVVVDRRKM